MDLVQRRRSPATRQESSLSDVRGEPPSAAWPESFSFAGSSALLLLIANSFVDCWYLSFFALTPFLYRIIRSVPTTLRKISAAC